MLLLKGTTLANTIKLSLKEAIQNHQCQRRRAPKLVMVLVGDDFASSIYVRNKALACKEIGMLSEVIQLSTDCSEAHLLQLIHKLNHDTNIDGILIQLPLPCTINVSKVLDAIHPLKDVDGFHPINIGLLAQGRPRFRACTPYGIIRLLDTLPIELIGMHAVIVGASNIVGKPMMLELLQAGCTVTICHVNTRELARHVNQADILISAIGKAGIIQSAWIKKEAIVIDAGINRDATGIVGDIAFNTASKRAYAITPVPGGVGPMTVAMLLYNTFNAYEESMGIKTLEAKQVECVSEIR